MIRLLHTLPKDDSGQYSRIKNWICWGIFLGLFLGIEFGRLQAQSSLELEQKNAFLSGKRLTEQGLYRQARRKLESLTIGYSKNPYNFPATYLYALGCYHLKDYYLTQVACENLARNYPTKKQIDEVYLLWGQSFFAEKNYEKGYELLDKIRQKEALETEIHRMKKHFLLRENAEKLKKLGESYPEDETLAEVLLFKIMRSAIKQHDWKTVDRLLRESGDTSANFSEPEEEQIEEVEITPPVYKDTYKIALLFPFNLQKPRNSAYSRNRPSQFAYDLYAGLRLGKQRLNELGIKVKFEAYDTQDDSATVARLLFSKELDEVDLIIEPSATRFTPDIAKFARYKNIGIINILSYRPDLQNNPYLFSVIPSYESQAKSVFKLVRDSLSQVQAYIYFGEEKRDSLMAHAYKEIVEENEGTVAVFKKVKKYRSGGYHAFSQFLRSKGKGHLFVCSSDRSLAANIVTALEVTKSRVPVFVTEEWLQFPDVSLEQYETSRVYFMLPQFIDPEGLYISDFRRDYYKEMKLIPSRYAYIGYETAHFFGNILKRFGTNFYQRIHTLEPEKGVLLPQLDYQEGNDNQFSPICRIINGKLQVVNLLKEEDADTDED